MAVDRNIAGIAKPVRVIHAHSIENAIRSHSMTREWMALKTRGRSTRIPIKELMSKKRRYPSS